MDDLEKAMAESLGKEMQKSMGFEIIADIMVSMRGYVRLDIDYWGNDNTWIEVRQWAEDNCTGEHQEHNGIWLFELEQDAIMFKLKWL